MNTRRSCWACNLRRQSCGRQSPRCARCVKYNFLCAWPDNGESVKQEAEGRKRGSGSAAAPRDKRQGVTQDLVVATAEEYLGLAAGGSYTPLRLEKVACARCRAHRRACDGARPACGRCAAKDLDCDYDTRKQSKRATSGQDDAEDGKIRRKSANKRVGMALLKVESAHTVESSSDFSDNFSRGLSRAQGGSPDRTPSPLLLQPIDQLEFPTWLDQSTINRLVRTFFDFKYLKTIPVVLHHSSFLDSLRSAPGEARPLLACIAYNCSLDVFAGNKSALRDLQRLAWRSLLSLRERFWAFNPPPLELAAVYIPALITAMYAAWKTAGLGAAKRFHEELVRAAYHVGIPSWSVSPPPPPTTARQWIAKNSLLFCWWNEAFGLDATFATGTQSSQLLLDPREWLDLELPVDPTIYNEVSMDAPLPDSISNLEKLTGRQVIGWTMLPPNSPERVALLANLQDAEGMWRRCGVFWGTPLSMALAQCLGESAKLRRWLVEKQLGPVWELGVAVQSGSPLHTFAAQMRQEILQSLADCRSMFPPVLAEAILNMDGYALVQNSQMNHWSSKTFGVTIGLEAIAMQLLAPPAFVNPSFDWYSSEDFVQATAHAITITRLTNSSSSHPFQNFANLSTVPYLILHASWVHILTLQKIVEESRANGSSADTVLKSALFVGLLQDTNTCVAFVRTSAEEGWRSMMAALDLLLKTLDGHQQQQLEGALVEFHKLQQIPRQEDPLKVMEELEEEYAEHGLGQGLSGEGSPGTVAPVGA